jgi:hypothetical protein
VSRGHEELGATVALLLDEMHAPAVARALRELGHDVIAVADRTDLRALSDGELFAWAAAGRRCIVTENVKDFRRLLLRADESRQLSPSLLFTSNRAFPRSRRNPGPLIAALDAWLRRAGPHALPAESWLRPHKEGPP